MDALNTLSFFLIMLALAAMPSTSVALVVTRAVTHGVPNGIAVAGGIVIGDLVFVALALLGMSVVAETMGAMFAVLKYAGGAYLIWLGISLLRSRAPFADLDSDSSSSSLIASGLAGLTLTLGDLKAILFYASLFPSMFNLSALSTRDVLLIVGVTVLTVGGVKMVYAISARRLAQRYSNVAVSRYAQTTAGAMLMGTGAYFIAKG